jgi:hypothetical protein
MIDLRAVLLAAAAAAASLPAQDPQPKEPVAPPPAAKPDAQAPDPEALVRKLVSDRFRERVDAEKALRELGAAAVPELKKAAEAGDDAEAQWRARRLLRQIEAGKADGALAPRGRDDAPPQGQPERPRREPVRDEFESLFERFERDFGIDVPRARFFDDGFFRDLQEQMKAGASRSQGMSMQIGPDGAVRVEIEERGADGKTEKKVYEAPDMDSFQRQHPGVLGRNGIGLQLPGGGMGWLRGFGGPFAPNAPQPPLTGRPRRGQLPPDAEVDGFDDFGGAAPAAPVPPPAGKRLGVSVRDEVPPDVRAYLELEDGVGLMVESVQDGSLAQALGLQRGDIVTRIAGTPIGSPQDVQAALGGVAQGADVEVAFVRKGVATTAKAPKAEAVDADAGKPAQPLKKRARKADDGSIR